MLFNLMFWSCMVLGLAALFVGAYGLVYGQDEIMDWIDERKHR